VGFEANVLWMAGDNARFGGDTRFLHQWVWKEGKLVEQGLMHLGNQLELGMHPIKRTSAVPVINSRGALRQLRHAVLAWSAERQKLHLQFLGEELAAPVASSSLLWELGPTLSPRAFRRPPLP
jgi:hypothetical protein